ncbi:hypothetical protein EMCRGX_G008861 [Ephydatia muelleri]
MGRRQRRNLARNAANARWKKTSDSAEIPGTNPITSNSKADISIVTNLASPSAAIESQGDGKLESEMEVKEDSYEGNGDISDERQDDGNMDGDENEDDGDVSQGDESCATDDDISEDDSHIGDPDYVPPVEIRIDEADSPDSNGLFVVCTLMGVNADYKEPHNVADFRTADWKEKDICVVCLSSVSLEVIFPWVDFPSRVCHSRGFFPRERL